MILPFLHTAAEELGEVAGEEFRDELGDHLAEGSLRAARGRSITEPCPNAIGAMSFSLESPDFTEGGAIPPRNTCEGEDVSPALQWRDPPDGTRSFALIVDDPDAPDPAHPRVTYVHWVLCDIPAGTSSLGRGVSGIGTSGVNDWNRTGYGGPCPPIGRHRYFFKLYALDTTLPALSRPTKSQLEQAMTGHILAEAKLMGTYEKIHSSERNGAGPALKR